ncbi:uncharacterized protein LOC143888577 [Tasmannia lanceolata]|uniref:uncharacterized protein LOC143888577 n=1 Tax=Tasmannia lanceolata TaxID=3420 RepID=UPI004064B72A
MDFKGVNDTIMCHAFSSYLKRGANSWYDCLKPNSISSLRELGRDFVTYFANSRPQKKPADALLALRQGKEETLRSFIGRFRAELSQIKDPNHEIVRAAMKSTIHDRDFMVALNIDPPRDLQELMAVTDKYVNNEESFVMERELELAKAPEKQKEETWSSNGQVKPPRPDNRQLQSNNRPPSQQLKRNAGSIDINAEGFTSGGPTISGQKAYATQIHAVEAPTKKLLSELTDSEEHIVFSEKDYDKVYLPHDEAVVARLIIANYNVSKVLLDISSYANILHYDAFKEMHLGMDRLISVEWSIYSFLGGSIRIEGRIELPVTFGTESRQKTIMQTFLVVKVPSTYNVIIGRLTFNKLQVVV